MLFNLRNKSGYIHLFDSKYKPMTVKMQLKYGSWTCFQVSKGSSKNYMSISKLTDKRTKIRPKTNHSKKARLILSAYHIRFVWFIYLFIFFLISFYVVNIIRCRWPHELPITYHSLFYDLEASSIPWPCVR